MPDSYGMPLCRSPRVRWVSNQAAMIVMSTKVEPAKANPSTYHKPVVNYCLVRRRGPRNVWFWAWAQDGSRVAIILRQRTLEHDRHARPDQAVAAEQDRLIRLAGGLRQGMQPGVADGRVIVQIAGEAVGWWRPARFVSAEARGEQDTAVDQGRVGQLRDQLGESLWTAFGEQGRKGGGWPTRRSTRRAACPGRAPADRARAAPLRAPRRAPPASAAGRCRWAAPAGRAGSLPGPARRCRTRSGWWSASRSGRRRGA